MENLNDSAKRELADAKKRFDEARVNATEAFNNVALSTCDRIVAMQYRVMCTILEKIDNPKEAIPACKLCLEELHSMPAVNKSFKVETTGGFLSLFNKVSLSVMRMQWYFESQKLLTELLADNWMRGLA